MHLQTMTNAVLTSMGTNPYFRVVWDLFRDLEDHDADDFIPIIMTFDIYIFVTSKIARYHGTFAVIATPNKLKKYRNAL